MLPSCRLSRSLSTHPTHTLQTGFPPLSWNTPWVCCICAAIMSVTVLLLWLEDVLHESVERVHRVPKEDGVLPHFICNLQQLLAALRCHTAWLCHAWCPYQAPTPKPIHWASQLLGIWGVQEENTKNRKWWRLRLTMTQSAPEMQKTTIHLYCWRVLRNLKWVVNYEGGHPSQTLRYAYLGRVVCDSSFAGMLFMQKSPFPTISEKNPKYLRRVCCKHENY